MHERYFTHAPKLLYLLSGNHGKQLLVNRISSSTQSNEKCGIRSILCQHASELELSILDSRVRHISVKLQAGAKKVINNTFFSLVSYYYISAFFSPLLEVYFIT
jgi:hypothetical protein